MKHNTMIKVFFTMAFVMLICVSFSNAQSAAKKPVKFVKKDRTVKKSQKKQGQVVLEGQITNTPQSNNTLTAAQQAEKDQIEYNPTNHNYSHTKTRNSGEHINNVIEQGRANNQQQQLSNLPLDGSLITTNFRTLINPQ